METIFDTPPVSVRNDLKALSTSLDRTVPKKKRSNILIATWNIRKFGNLTRQWLPGGRYSPKRDLRALRSIVEILSRFDVIAVQEVTGNLRALRDTMKYLGDRWSFLMTDITRGDAGNYERLAFIFNNTRVQTSGLACEVVVPPDLHAVKRSIFIGEGDNPMLEKFYDQIAWFTSASGKSRLSMEYLQGGGFDFLPFVYTDQGLSKNSLSHRISDHYPLWVEFRRAREKVFRQ